MAGKKMQQQVRQGIRLFWGNVEPDGFHFSTKKFFFSVFSLAALLFPVILVSIGKVSGRDALDYFKITFPAAMGFYVGGKAFDNRINTGSWTGGGPANGPGAH